jgi:phage shock protein PspC (stress-responsive transcriptional regulator)
MNTNTVNPEARLPAGPPPGTGSRRTALRRPVQGSVVAGVAAGLARYLGVDVMIIRLAFVVLALADGAGIPLYLATGARQRQTRVPGGRRLPGVPTGPARAPAGIRHQADDAAAPGSSQAGHDQCSPAGQRGHL